MLGVSRPSVAVAPTDVNQVLQEALQLLGPQLRQGHVTLTVTLDEHLPLVLASADQLKQVFLNLLLNAKEAMPQGGGLLVQSRLAHEGDAELLAGRHVVVRIRDDGAGIPPEIVPRVFEPFFSTKAERQGTGLGLWVCQDIIQHHGGQIIVRSMVGKGTTFLVALPFIRSPGQSGEHDSIPPT
jgi:two-component system NtrC family sensor kinase